MPAFGPMELIIILVLVVILFGVGKLPDVGAALGKGIKEFRSATSDDPKNSKSGDSDVSNKT